MRTPRLLAALLLALTALVIGACGGSDDEGGSSSEDVNELLTQTFTGDKQMDSGKVSLAFTLEAQGEGAEELQGPVKVTLDGPFDASDKERCRSSRSRPPSRARGRASPRARRPPATRATSPSRAPTTWSPTRSSSSSRRTTSRRASRRGQNQGQSLATLGLDPRKWLIDPQNAGEAQVGDTDTIKITAGIDVNKLLEDANSALAAASALGAPRPADPREADRGAEAAGRRRDQGPEDRDLHRQGRQDPAAPGARSASRTAGSAGTISFDVSITDLNEPQDIPEPERAAVRPSCSTQLGALGPSAAVAAARAPAAVVELRLGRERGGAAARATSRPTPSASTKAGDDVRRPATARTCWRRSVGDLS